jgi:hypothetical protein
MHTVEELEYIRRGILERGTLDQQELVYFARSLHELFLSVGLDSKYKVPDNYYTYYMSTSTEVRVVVNNHGWYVQVIVSAYSRTLMHTFDSKHPTSDIQGLVYGLHATCKVEEAVDYCQPCHYSDSSVGYCGLGIGPALGCIHLTTNQRHE